MTELKGAGIQGGGYGGLPWSHEQASPDFLSSLTSGGCKWIRTPAIIYSVHTMTTLIPILSTLLLDDFSKASHFRGQGPKTFQERLFLISVYIPYFLIPLILLLFMVRNPYYKSEEKRKKK